MRVLPISFNWQNIQITVPRSTSLIRLIRRNAPIVRSKFDCSFSSIAFFHLRSGFFFPAASAASGIDPNEREITLMSTKIVSNGSNNSTRARACTRTRYTFFLMVFRSIVLRFSLVFFSFFSIQFLFAFGLLVVWQELMSTTQFPFVSLRRCAMCDVCWCAWSLAIASERCASDYYRYYDYCCYCYSYVNERQACHVHTKSTRITLVRSSEMERECGRRCGSKRRCKTADVRMACGSECGE